MLDLDHYIKLFISKMEKQQHSKIEILVVLKYCVKGPSAPYLEFCFMKYWTDNNGNVFRIKTRILKNHRSSDENNLSDSGGVILDHPTPQSGKITTSAPHSKCQWLSGVF